MMKRSLIASGLLHVAVIAAATVAWPRAIDFSSETPPVVPVELVTIADVTDIAPSVEEIKQPDTPEELAPPQPEAAPPPLPQAEIAPAVLDKTEKPKDPPKETKPQTAEAPPNPVVPRRKPVPQQKQNFDVDSVIALLDKRTPKPAPVVAAKPAETTVKGIGAQDAFTMDLKDALLNQMRECWNVPVGAPNPEQLIVQVRIFLAQDGSLSQRPALEPATRNAAAGNQYMRTAAEAALRAIDVCAPYKRLPTDKYAAWAEIVMTFDPSKMIGR